MPPSTFNQSKTGGVRQLPQLICTSTLDGTIRVWDPEETTCLRIESGHAAAFSRDGEWLVVARGPDDRRTLPCELFAPLADNLRVARARVTRQLTAAERDEHLRELTAAEREELLRQPPPALEGP